MRYIYSIQSSYIQKCGKKRIKNMMITMHTAKDGKINFFFVTPCLYYYVLPLNEVLQNKTA